MLEENRLSSCSELCREKAKPSPSAKERVCGHPRTPQRHPSVCWERVRGIKCIPAGRAGKHVLPVGTRGFRSDAYPEQSWTQLWELLCQLLAMSRLLPWEVGPFLRPARLFQEKKEGLWRCVVCPDSSGASCGFFTLLCEAQPE